MCFWHCCSERQPCGSGLCATGLAQHAGQVRQLARGRAGSELVLHGAPAAAEPDQLHLHCFTYGLPHEVWTKISQGNTKLESQGSHLGFQAILKVSSGTENRLKSMRLFFVFLLRPFGWVCTCLLALVWWVEKGVEWEAKGPAATSLHFCMGSLQHAQPDSVALGPCPSPRLQPQHRLPSGELLKTSLHMVHSISRLAC